MELFSQLEVNNKLQGKLGIRNYGDSSFVNAIIQALSNIEPVCFAIREMPCDLPKSIGNIEDAVERSKRINIFYAFRKILRELWKDKRMVIEPATLLRRMNEVEILKDSIANTSIEDTFLYLLETLHDTLSQPVPSMFETRINFKSGAPIWDLISMSEEIQGSFKKALERGALESLAYDRSVITDSFQGILSTSTTCSNCGSKEQSLDSFFSLSLSIICNSGHKSAHETLKSDFVISSSSLDSQSRKSRKLLTENWGSDKSPRRRSVFLKNGDSSLTNRNLHPSVKPKPRAPKRLETKKKKKKVHPLDSDPKSPDLKNTESDETKGVNEAAPSENKKTSDDNAKSHPPPFNRLLSLDSPLVEGSLTKRKTLKPLTESIGNSSLHSKKISLKKNKYKKSDSSDQIDYRIDKELSQSSSDSNANNLEQRKKMDVNEDVTSNEVQSADVESCKKIKPDSLANVRQQRKHQMNLSSLTPAEIAAQTSRRSSVSRRFSSRDSQDSLRSIKSTRAFRKTSRAFKGGVKLSVQVMKQAKVAMDIQIGHKAMLHDCIQDLLAEEPVVDHVCSSCSHVGNTVKKKKIASAPEVLVFYFKRFMNSGFFQTKDNTLINFPLESFDISDFLDMSSGYFKSGWDQKSVYDLQVVIRHVGKNKQSNCYTTLARHHPEGKWFEYHDHRVRVVSKRYVLSREALMLFYVRRRGNSPVVGKDTDKDLTDLQEAARMAVLDRREAIVDELNYLLRLDHINKVNKLKNTLSPSEGKVMKTVRNSIKTLLRLSRVQKIRAQSAIDNNAEPYGSVSRPPLSRNCSSYNSFMSYTDTLTSDGHGSGKKLNPGWRVVRKSLQKIVMLGQDPSLSFDHAHIILEIPPTKHIFISIYWLIKFLSFSEPGPLCNHDIACCHGALKPHLYNCRKRICIPVPIDLFERIRDYIRDKFGYPHQVLPSSVSEKEKNGSNSISFRELRSTIPCSICIEDHEDLMQRRQEERESVILECIRDGFEDLLPEEDTFKLAKLVRQEKKRREQEVASTSNEDGEGVQTQQPKLSGVSDDANWPVHDSERRSLGSISIRPADEVLHYFIISKTWLDSWKKFCLAGQYEDIEYPYPPPGPISNFDLLVAGGPNNIKPDLVLDQDYCVVSPGVWSVLHEIYGGGPIICREDINIYSTPCGAERNGVVIC